ncbi:hypothetical protein BGX26_002352 [Mortierella sp. AD094]|nr:hypothetical protein BGX26_002352 [Mortierella sp. AD094]
MRPENPDREKDIKNLWEGKLRFIKVALEQDPKWAQDAVYGTFLQQYYGIYKDILPEVPAVMTLCDIEDAKDDPGHELSVRLDYHTMVLEPVRWVLHVESFGEPIIGSAFGDTIRKAETTRNVKLYAKVDFEGSAAIKGAYRAITGSATISGSAGASWQYEEKEFTMKEETIKKNERYQPVRLFAKLECRVIRAKTGSFSVNNFFEEEEKKSLGLELITTNARHEKIQNKHKASGSGFVKTLEDMYPLYKVCGRELTTTRSHFGGWNLKYRIAVGQLKVAVDPTDATLYVNGTGGCNVVGPRQFFTYASTMGLGTVVEALVKMVDGLEYKVAPLTDYRGLWGKTAENDKLQNISYSVGNNVKVWVTPILAV